MNLHGGGENRFKKGHIYPVVIYNLFSDLLRAVCVEGQRTRTAKEWFSGGKSAYMNRFGNCSDIQNSGVGSLDWIY